MALKSETIGLAISLELPLLIIDIQRGGPSTGLPTKTEQSDLLLAMYGRHGESPLPIVAAYSPSNCFDVAIEAARMALTYRTPVILLSDGYLANGSEPWLLPDVDALAPIEVPFATEPNHVGADGEPEFWPYLRDPETLARPLGPARHARPRCTASAASRRRTAAATSATTRPTTGAWSICGRPRSPASPGTCRRSRWWATPTTPSCWWSGWGSTWGAISGAVDRVRDRGRKVAQIHLTHLNPFPPNLGEVLARYPKVLVPEMNLGQLSRLLRAEYLVDARSRQQGQGRALHRRRARDRRSWRALDD